MLLICDCRVIQRDLPAAIIIIRLQHNIACLDLFGDNLPIAQRKSFRSQIISGVLARHLVRYCDSFAFANLLIIISRCRVQVDFIPLHSICDGNLRALHIGPAIIYLTLLYLNVSRQPARRNFKILHPGTIVVMLRIFRYQLKPASVTAGVGRRIIQPFPIFIKIIHIFQAADAFINACKLRLFCHAIVGEALCHFLLDLRYIKPALENLVLKFLFPFHIGSLSDSFHICHARLYAILPLYKQQLIIVLRQSIAAVGNIWVFRERRLACPLRLASFSIQPQYRCCQVQFANCKSK